MSRLGAIDDGQMPIGYEDIKAVESADICVAHIVTTESGHEAPVRFEDDHKSFR